MKNNPLAILGAILIVAISAIIITGIVTESGPRTVLAAGHTPTSAEWANITNDGPPAAIESNALESAASDVIRAALAKEKHSNEGKSVKSATSDRSDRSETISEEEFMGPPPGPALVNRYHIESVPIPFHDQPGQTLLRYDTTTGRAWLYETAHLTNRFTKTPLPIDGWVLIPEDLAGRVKEWYAAGTRQPGQPSQ